MAGESSRPVALPVTIDFGPAVHQSAGLSRYADRLVAHLVDDERIDLTLFHNSHSGHNVPQKFSAVRQHSIPMDQLRWRLGALFSQRIGLPRLNRTIVPMNSPRLPKGAQAATGVPRAASVYHATEHLLPRVASPSILTVHDLIFERFPQHHTARNRLFLKFAMPTFVRAADAIIAVSHHTKRDLQKLYGTSAEKITVVYEGVDERFKPASQEQVASIKARYSPTRPYWLMVGTLEPRKNHATALRAITRLMAQGDEHQLVIAGGKGWLFEPILALVDELGLTDRVTFAGYVPDEDLPTLYSGASAVLVPSLYEGFGFSVLEAMACGAPVIASNVSSLGEVAGDAALLLDDPEDDEALAALMARITREPELAADLTERGQIQAGKFRWEDTARRTADLYLDLAERVAMQR